MLVHPSLTAAAARKMDDVVWSVLDNLVGYHIPLENEDLGWDYEVQVPIEALSNKTFQSWVSQLPIKLGGLGLRSQVALAPVAYLACLEQTVPFFIGERGVCPQLSHLVGKEEDRAGRLSVTWHTLGYPR